MFIEQPTKNDLLFVKQMQNMVMNFIKKDNYRKDESLELKNLVDFRNNDLIKENEELNDNIDEDNRLNVNKWLSYPKSIALVSEKINFVKEYNSEKCKFWQSFGLDEYAWIC